MLKEKECDTYYSEGIEKMRLIEKAQRRPRKSRGGYVVGGIFLLFFVVGGIIIITGKTRNETATERGRIAEKVSEEIVEETDQAETVEEEKTEIVFESLLEPSSGKEEEQDFDHARNRRIDIQGMTIEVPAVWTVYQDTNYFIETGAETTMFQWRVCDEKRHAEIRTEEEMLEKAEDFAQHWNKNMEETQIEEVKMVEYNGRKYSLVRFRTAIIAEGERTDFECELGLFFHPQIRYAVGMIMMQSTESAYDHFEDFHKVMASVIETEQALPQDTADIVEIGDLQYYLPKYYDIRNDDSTDNYQKYSSSYEGYDVTLILSHEEGIGDFKEKTDEEIAEQFFRGEQYMILKTEDAMANDLLCRNLYLLIQSEDGDPTHCYISYEYDEKLHRNNYEVLFSQVIEVDGVDFFNDFIDMVEGVEHIQP